MLTQFHLKLTSRRAPVDFVKLLGYAMARPNLTNFAALLHFIRGTHPKISSLVSSTELECFVQTLKTESELNRM